MKNSKLFKMICLMLSLVMIFSMSAFAVDETNMPVVFESVEHEHDGECVDNMNDEQDFLEYYRDNYGVNLIEVEIDGEIYYINEDIEITEDFINSIKTNAENRTFDISMPENIEHIHADDIINEEYIHTENAVYEEQDPIEYCRDNYGINLIEIEINGEIYYIDEKDKDFYDERDSHDIDNENSTDSVCYSHRYGYITCGKNYCQNWCGYYFNLDHSYPGYKKISPVGYTNVCHTWAQVCAICDTSLSSTFTVTQHSPTSVGLCGNTICTICNYTAKGNNHRLSQITVIIGLPTACWESIMYCYNSGCNYFYSAYTERNHNRANIYAVCQSCGWQY